MKLPELKKSKDGSVQGIGAIFFKSFLWLFFAVAILAALSWSFGWVAVEKYGQEELFEKYQSSRPESRPLILVEWMRVISQNPDKTEFFPDLAQEERFRFDLNNLKLEESTDKNLAAPLISLLGFANDKEKTVAALMAFSARLPQHQGLESHIALIFSFGRLGVWSEELRNYFELSSRDGDPSVRKATAYVLGSHKDWPVDSLMPLLLALLRDPAEDVRWNAALSIYRLGRDEAHPLLRELLAKTWTPEFKDRSSITLVEEQLYAQVFSTLVQRPVPEFQNELKKIADSYPHVKLRRLALDALKD